jgi:1-deoxy-D-xylulose-5-phosphate reductoisomerase
VTLNAANEIAVERFLQGALTFDRIPGLIEDVLSRVAVVALRDLDHVLDVDREARALASELLAGGATRGTARLHG